MTPRQRAKRNANGRGGVYRRADGRWEGEDICRHTGRATKRISVYGGTEREVARRVEDKLRDQQRRGIPVATTTMTVAEYMTYWLEHVAEPAIRRTTYATYEGDVRLHIVPGIGNRKLKTLQSSIFGPG